MGVGCAENADTTDDADDDYLENMYAEKNPRASCDGKVRLAQAGRQSGGGPRHAATNSTTVLTGPTTFSDLPVSPLPHTGSWLADPPLALHAPAPMSEISLDKCDFRQTMAVGRVRRQVARVTLFSRGSKKESEGQPCSPHCPVHTSSVQARVASTHQR